MTVLRGLGILCALGLLSGVLWVMLCHGAGQVALRRAVEPAADLAPASLPALPQDRPLRLLLLGTSLTFSGSWPEALQHRLAACHAAGVTVERLAKPGANSAWGEGALRQRLAAGPVPDILVVEFSINDSSLWRGMRLAASRARHEAILDMAQQAGIPVWLATMSPAFGRKALERPGQVAYRALYGELARDRGAGLIAMAPAWLALGASDRGRLVPDDLHPTEAAMIGLAVPALAAALGRGICDLS